MWSTSSSRFISNLMEYGYSSTIIASVKMSALLFFPYTLEWVECDSWAFKSFMNFKSFWDIKWVPWHVVRVDKELAASLGVMGYQVSSTYWGPGFTRCILGLLCISTKNRGPLSGLKFNNYFAVVQLLSQQLVQDLKFIASQKKIFTNVSEQIIFWQLNISFFFLSPIWFIYI